MINGNAMRLLGVFTEPVGEDLIHLAQSIPSHALRTVIDSAFRAGQSPTQQSEVLQHLPAPPEPDDHMEGVITVETLLGERRNLQITCYPYVQPPLVGEAGGGARTPRRWNLRRIRRPMRAQRLISAAWTCHWS
jgi:hypothetical protein